MLGWHDEFLQGADLLENPDEKVRLFVNATKRGLFNPGRLLVQTRYPVGLFRAWSWVDLNTNSVVYPKPLPSGALPSATNVTNEGESLKKQGVDDFYGLREYQNGDALRHVAWKSFARTDDLLTKEFAAFVDRRVWLDWEYFPGQDAETRLSRLCFAVIQLSQTNDDYGLRLPNVEIAPANSPEHKEKVLRALALFDAGGES